MRGKRIESKIKAKIIESKINNPDLSSRDLEKKTGIDHSTIARVVSNDLRQVSTQSQHIAKLIDRNNNLQSLADQLIAEKLANREENVRLSELVSLRESTFKQNQLITGGNTENQSIKIEVFDGDED